MVDDVGVNVAEERRGSEPDRARRRIGSEGVGLRDPRVRLRAVLILAPETAVARCTVAL